MTILIISGSRNPQGQTARAANALLEGAKSAGASGEVVFLPHLHIERCRQCDDQGWGTCIKEGRCVVEDDFHSLAGRIRESDAVVFATPVYFSDLSESLRAFLDRFRRMCMYAPAKEAVAGKKAIGICVAGGGGGGAPECCASLSRFMSICGLDAVDMIPVRRQNLEMKVALLAETGQRLAAEG